MNTKLKKGMAVFASVCILGSLFTVSVLAKDSSKKRDFSKKEVQIQKIELTEEQKAEMKAKLEAKLEEKVEKGEMTREEADAKLGFFGEGSKGGQFKRERPELTDEQKAEMQESEGIKKHGRGKMDRKFKCRPGVCDTIE